MLSDYLGRRWSAGGIEPHFSCRFAVKSIQLLAVLFIEVGFLFLDLANPANGLIVPLAGALLVAKLEVDQP